MNLIRRYSALSAKVQYASLLLALSVLSCQNSTLEAPRIDGLEPSRVELGREIEAKISGRNFRTQPIIVIDSRESPLVSRVFDVWLGSNALPTDAVAYVNDTTLTIVVPKTLALGQYDLGVRAPSGQWATLKNALTVYDPNSTSSGGATGNTSGASTATIDAGAGGAGGIVNSKGGSTSGGVQGGGASTTDVGTSSASGGANSNFGTGGALFTSIGGATSADGTGGTTAGSGGIGGQSSIAATGGVDGGTSETHATLWTKDNTLRDVCGNVLVLRGVQQVLDDQVVTTTDWPGLMDEIAATGANAVRIQVQTETLGISGVDAVLARIASHNMVAILNPDVDSWLAEPTVVSMLGKYEDRVIIDALLPAYNDRTKFLSEALAAISQIRSYGYRVPLIVYSNLYGRDLPAAMDYGEQIVQSDPLLNTIIYWEAFWGDSFWYQGRYNMSLTEGMAKCAQAPFPIQLGLTLVTDEPDELLDYDSAMTTAQAEGLSWLWWDWYNPRDSDSNLSADGTIANLLPIGKTVVQTHPAGLAHTFTTACELP